MKTRHNEEFYRWLSQLEDQPLSELRIGVSSQDWTTFAADAEQDGRVCSINPSYDYLTPNTYEEALS